jgi:hypothetical protein
LTAAAKVVPAAGAKAVAELALGVLDEAVLADRFADALTLAGVAESAARRSRISALVSRAQAQAKELKEVQTEFEAAKVAMETLKAKPDDPSAHGTAGRYLSLRKGDWDKGLPHLAKGDNSALAEIAKKDLASPTKATEQVDLGDVWWDRAEIEKVSHVKAQFQRRAAHWYQRAAVPGRYHPGEGREADQAGG